MTMSSTDKNAFLAVYKEIESEILSDLRSLPALSDEVKSQLTAHYAECLPHTVPGGKMTRGLTVVKG